MKDHYLNISVVVACYNAEKYIGANLKSLLDQNYPNLEIIVMDGISTDGTLDVINSFEDSAVKLYSQKDKGQYDAINKGLDLCTGDILCWLNADDVSLPWTLNTVNKVFSEYEDVDWIIGKNMFLNESGTAFKTADRNVVYPRRFIKHGMFHDKALGFLQQESMFWRREVWEASAKLDLDYGLAADFKLWTDFAIRHELYAVDTFLSAFRVREDSRSKIGIIQYRKEVAQIIESLRSFSFLATLFDNTYLYRVLSLITFPKGPCIRLSGEDNSIEKLRKRRPLFKYSIIKLLFK